ncbi:hypothetical protein GCK72_011478 [Caenorhabditis remanei]|uniref:Uncharacterized protein n=1 Tax=Caenorhabditis remanei TaxID=31234 RepID=A0A6A5H9Y0_CAERE|nr:hypothetical protein GCK72_011478 [Caenorhabditis remanei]KAF1763212.1 hypothetical protein GCK72_011478 [Caenorhabditis remanei]
MNFPIVFFLLLSIVSLIMTMPINYGASLNAVHSDDLSAEDYNVLRKNETRIERIHKLQHFFNEDRHESTWTWRDTICGAFHSLSLFPPNCFKEE